MELHPKFPTRDSATVILWHLACSAPPARLSLRCELARGDERGVEGVPELLRVLLLEHVARAHAERRRQPLRADGVHAERGCTAEAVEQALHL